VKAGHKIHHKNSTLPTASLLSDLYTVSFSLDCLVELSRMEDTTIDTTAVAKAGVRRLESLPSDVRFLIMRMLHVKDLVSLVTASEELSKAAEKGLDIAKLLKKERLPGSTVEDLILYVTQWEKYRQELVQSLHDLIPGVERGDMESDEGRQAYQDFLKNAILGYTQRVAGAHSWYKHLPIARGYCKFAFFLDLTSNMYRRNGKWINAVEGDGTRFHYTWTTTSDYRERFGFFDYREDQSNTVASVNSSPPLKVHYHSDEEVHVPNYALGFPVEVTAAMHQGSGRHNMYVGILSQAVNSRDPSLVNEELSAFVLPSMQSRFFNLPGSKLPSPAAADLERITSEILSRDEELAEEELRNTLRRKAQEALRAQMHRERCAIATSLWELCCHNFGNEWVPTLEDILASSRLH
jgi:hypothetical protein